MNNYFNYQVLNEIKLIQRNFIVEVYLYKIKKPLKIKRLTTVIVLKAGLEPARPLLTTGF